MGTTFILIPVQLKFKLDLADAAEPVLGLDSDSEPSPRRRHNKALRIRNEYGVQYTLHDSLRIRGGNASDTLNFPYMAAIMINGRLWCAGAIVDVNWVVTAAHCLN